MNKVILCGRLTKDPDIRYTTGQTSKCVARFSLAVDRPGKQENGPTADFPSIVAFDKRGEFAEKFLKQGTKVIVVGRLQTGSYTDRNGNKVYTTDVLADEFEFAESKGDAAQAQPKQKASDNASKLQETGDGFLTIPDGVEDEGLPFN